MAASETTSVLGLKRYAASGNDVFETDDWRDNVDALDALFVSGPILKHEKGGIEADISAIANGGILVGTGTGTMAVRASAMTGGASGFIKHELGGLEFDASAIANGGILVGTGTGTMAIRASALTGGASGFVKHEIGGLEFDASGIADGGMIVGTGGGTMAIRASALSGGASGFLKHELGGLEFNASAIADGGMLVGTDTGTMAIRASALSGGASGFFKHELGGLEFNASAVTTGDVIAGASSGTMAIVAASGASDGDVLTLQADGTVDYETPAGGGGKIQAVGFSGAFSGSTTSSSYADISSANVSLTTTKGGLIAVWHLAGYNSTISTNNYFALQLDSASEVGQVRYTQPIANQDQTMAGVYAWTSVSNASHRVDVRFNTSGGTFNIREGHLLLMEFDD